jgi:hypothetical protein
VYNHFANVEDAVVAVSIQSTTRRADLISRAALFRGRPRERIAAMGSVARALLPYHQRHEVLLSAIKRDRVPEDRLRRLMAQEERQLAVFTGVIRDAVAVGDLELPPELTPEQFALGLLQMWTGPLVLALRDYGVGEYDGQAAVDLFVDTMTRLLDVLGWRPLSTELDYPAMIERMWREVFPELLEKFDSPLLKAGR